MKLEDWTKLRFTDKGMAIQPIATIQLMGKKTEPGKKWQNSDNAHLAVNSRYTVREKLLAKYGNEFTYVQARNTLGLMGNLLGSGTPVSYIKAFVKEGILEIVK